MKKASYVGVSVAAVAQFMLGAVWYTVFSKPWMEGVGKTMDQLTKDNPYGNGLPYILAFFCNLLIARVIAAVVVNSGEVTAKRGAAVGAGLWLGCAFAVLLNGYAFEGRGPGILAINGGYQLVCFVVAGVIAGAWKQPTA